MKWRVLESLVDSIADDDPPPRSSSAFDAQWREGYGFNNPNPERKRQGLPPVNFDGSVHDGN